MKDTRYLNVILTLLTIVLALNLVVTWGGSPSLLPRAQAQGIPDEGAQRNQIIDQLRQLNKRADSIHELMASGRLYVHVANPRAGE